MRHTAKANGKLSISLPFFCLFDTRAPLPAMGRLVTDRVYRDAKPFRVSPKKSMRTERQIKTPRPASAGQNVNVLHKSVTLHR